MLIVFLFENRDAALYALGVGACARDAVDDDELKYVYHENGQKFVQVLLICPGNYYWNKKVLRNCLPIICADFIITKDDIHVFIINGFGC